MTDKDVTTTEVVENQTHVVIDGSDLDAVLANARGEPIPVKETKPTEIKQEEAKAEIEPDEETGLTEEEKKTYTDKMLKTIGKKHRAQKEAEEFAQTQFNEKKLAEKRAEQLERENQRLKEQMNPPKIEEAPKEPDRANFKTDKEYSDAMIDYRVDQKLREREAKEHAKAVEDRQREIEAEAQGRIAKAREIVPDFDEVMENADVEVPTNIAGYMQESDMFAELGYHFAKNPEVLENLAKLSPAKQLVAIGKIESTLKPFSEKSEKVENGEKPSPKAEKPANGETPSTNAKASKARPEPIKPLDTGSASQVEKPESEMDFKEVFAQWQKTHKVNLTKRRRH